MPSHSNLEFDPRLDACPMCGSSAIRGFDRDFNGVCIDRCDACELLFMNPQYTNQHLDDYYSKYIPPDIARDAAITRLRAYAKKKHLEIVERFVRAGSLLSIGCGDGLELEIASARGWHVEAFDVDEETTRRVALRSNVRVHCGDFFRIPWRDNHYDCVFMDQVLEHPKNPQEYLRTAWRILRPGGVLFVGCPNIRSLSSLWKGWLGRAGLKRKRRGRHYDTSHHLFYYSPRTLPRIVEDLYGFQVVAVQGDPYSGQTPFDPESSLVQKMMMRIRESIPLFDSTFCMVCRKRTQVAQVPRTAAA